MVVVVVAVGSKEDHVNRTQRNVDAVWNAIAARGEVPICGSTVSRV